MSRRRIVGVGALCGLLAMLPGRPAAPSTPFAVGDLVAIVTQAGTLRGHVKVKTSDWIAIEDPTSKMMVSIPVAAVQTVTRTVPAGK